MNFHFVFETPSVRPTQTNLVHILINEFQGLYSRPAMMRAVEF